MDKPNCITDDKTTYSIDTMGVEINLYMFLMMRPYFVTFFLIFTRPLVKSAYQKVTFLFLNQNIFCEYSKEPFQ